MYIPYAYSVKAVGTENTSGRFHSKCSNLTPARADFFIECMQSVDYDTVYEQINAVPLRRDLVM